MRPQSWMLILCCVTPGALQAGAERGRPTVTTKYGRLRGVTVPVKTDRTVHAFYGVPYAKPPMGLYRFTALEPPEGWSSVKEAAEYPPIKKVKRQIAPDTKGSEAAQSRNVVRTVSLQRWGPVWGQHMHGVCMFSPCSRASPLDALVFNHTPKIYRLSWNLDCDPPMCLQSSELLQWTHKLFGAGAEIKLPPFSEDCLYLNIYTPADRGQRAKLPVMVFIHGGALLVGGAAFYDGSALSAYEDVVLVVVQYRLGILGFLCTGDGQASGNYGFLDQVAALRWVQENIADFGGDPDAVTIFGESAGSVSVSVLMLSPLSKDLFHRAIVESGVALIPGVIVNETTDLLHFRDVVASISGCEPTGLVDCLRKKTTDELLSVMSHMTVPNLPVCVDGVVLTEPSEETLYTKQVYSAPLIIGVNDQECGWLLPKLLNASDILEEMDKETVLENLKNFPHLGVSPHMIPSLVDEYFGGTDDPAELRNRFLDLCGDVSLVIPSLRAARYHRDSGSPVFFYEFQHHPLVLQDRRSAFVKSDHGDELMFVFGGPFLRDGAFFSMGDAPDEERTLSKTVMKYWANFARNGDPNGPGLVLWPQFDHEEGYLEINLKQRLAKDLRPGKTEFWTEKIQKIPSNKHTEL